MVTRTYSSADPLFVGNTTLPVGVTTSKLLSDENWSLKSNSPAINFGSTDKVDYDYDLQNNIRLIGTNIDCGAYEYSVQPVFVTPLGAGDKKGSSWANALEGNGIDTKTQMTNLNLMLRTAPPKTIVYLKAGEYFASADVSGLNDTAKQFIIRNSIEIFGGFAGRELSHSERCDTALSRFTAKEATSMFNIIERTNVRFDKIEMSGSPNGIVCSKLNKLTVSHCILTRFSHSGILASASLRERTEIVLFNSKFCNCGTA